MPENTEITFGWEQVANLLAEPNIKALILSYWEELSPMKQVVPLDPDFDRMVQLEGHGMFRAWAARDGGLLIGFILWHTVPHLNYRTTLFAIDGGHYLDPLSRGADWTGVKMWRKCLEALSEMGVKVVMAHDNMLRPLGPFFARLGFEPRSQIFWKAI